MDNGGLIKLLVLVRTCADWVPLVPTRLTTRGSQLHSFGEVSAPSMKDPIARCIMRSRGGLVAAALDAFFRWHHEY